LWLEVGLGLVVGIVTILLQGDITTHCPLHKTSRIRQLRTKGMAEGVTFLKELFLENSTISEDSFLEIDVRKVCFWITILLSF
jgi:hypothetical protein